MLDKQYVVVFFDLSDGIDVFGPFDDEAEAIKFGQSTHGVKGRWRVVPLQYGYGGDPWPQSTDLSLH